MTSGSNADTEITERSITVDDLNANEHTQMLKAWLFYLAGSGEWIPDTLVNMALKSISSWSSVELDLKKSNKNQFFLY